VEHETLPVAVDGHDNAFEQHGSCLADFDETHFPDAVGFGQHRAIGVSGGSKGRRQHGHHKTDESCGPVREHERGAPESPTSDNDSRHYS
jgi:hypothetical protein